MLTQERLKELLHYDPESGVFTWLHTRSVVWAGDIAGTLKNDGYIVISIDGVRYGAHRLAFLYMTGSMPDVEVDHKNCVKADNRWVNLRLASRSENCLNRGMLGHNKSGHKGVSWNSNKRRWIARAQINGKPIHIGAFKSLEEAAKAYEVFAISRYGDFAHMSLINN